MLRRVLKMTGCRQQRPNFVPSRAFASKGIRNTRKYTEENNEPRYRSNVRFLRFLDPSVHSRLFPVVREQGRVLGLPSPRLTAHLSSISPPEYFICNKYYNLPTLDGVLVFVKFFAANDEGSTILASP